VAAHVTVTDTLSVSGTLNTDLISCERFLPEERYAASISGQSYTVYPVTYLSNVICNDAEIQWSNNSHYALTCSKIVVGLATTKFLTFATSNIPIDSEYTNSWGQIPAQRYTTTTSGVFTAGDESTTQYTPQLMSVSELPLASEYEGYIVYVQDGYNGSRPTLAVSNGTKWYGIDYSALSAYP